MNVGKSFLWLVVFLLCAHASLLPKLSHAQEATSGVIPLATMEPGEPEQRLREFFEGDYDFRQETWDYPSADEPKIVSCNSVHSMGVDGFVLFVRNECQDGTRFLGLHSFDRRVNKYFNPGFSNGGGYVGGMYAEFQSDGSRYVSNAPTTAPMIMPRRIVLTSASPVASGPSVALRAGAPSLAPGNTRLPQSSAWAVRPPSTTSAEPVVNELLGSTRNMIASATSSGLPCRPTGCWRARCSRFRGSG